MSNTTTNARAADFLDSLGVNIKASMLQGEYRNSASIITSLNYIGVGKVRDALVQYGEAAPVLDALADAGIRFDFRVSSSLPAKGREGMADYIAALKAFDAEHPGAILAVEGLNEANVFYFKYNGEFSVDAAAEFQKFLYTSINLDSQLKDISVYNFTIAQNTPENYAKMGNLGSYSDAANIHLYVSTARSIDARIEYVMDLGRDASRGDPVVITEIGQPTLPSYDIIGVSETAQAKMVLSQLLLAYENGAEETYLYELFDNTLSADRSSKEAHFGLFDRNGDPKRAAEALHNLTAVLAFGDKGTADGTLPVDYEVKTSADTVHAMGLEKSGGVYDIVVWNDLPVWNDETDRDVTNPIVSTTVEFGRVEGVVRIYDPMSGLAPIVAYRNVDHVVLPLRDSPLVIEVGASSAARDDDASIGASLTLTVAELVARIDTLAQSDALERIALSDSSVLAVSSTETMRHLIEDRAEVLDKIVGGYSFSVAYGGETWTKVRNYDAAGALTLTVDYVLDADGDVVSRSELQPDGARDYYRYEIEGKAYVREHQAFDAAGDLTLLVRFHADGSFHLRDAYRADGSRLYETYDSDGRIVQSVLTGADGGTTSKSYDHGGLVSQVVREADGDVRTSTYDDGVRLKLTVDSHEGWLLHRTYSASTGLTLTETLTKADGSRVYSVYDGDDRLLSRLATAADGSKVHTAWSEDGESVTSSYSPSGAALVRDVRQSDGTHEVYAYADGQKLEGGGADDIFHFRDTAGGRMVYEGGDDMIWDFNTDSGAADRIVLYSDWATSFSGLSLTQKGGDVLIRFDGDDSILVENQTVGDLSAGHFLFV